MVGLSGALVLGLAASPADALTAEEVLSKLDENARCIASFSLELKSSAKNVGAHGKVLRDFTHQEKVSLSKSSQVVRRKNGDDEQLWDSKNKVQARKVPWGWRKEPYKGTTEQSMPPVLNYVAFPQKLLTRMEIAEVTEKGGRATIVAHPKGFAAKQTGKPRWEVQVDMRKGVIDQIRTINAAGDLVEDVRLQGWVRRGGCWMPRRAVLRRYAARNVVTMRFTLSKVEMNSVSEESLTLP